MFWLKMIPDLLGIINYFIKQAQKRGYISEGYQKRIDEELLKLHQSMQTVKRINDLVDNANDAQLNELFDEYAIAEDIDEVKATARSDAGLQRTQRRKAAASTPSHKEEK